MNVQAVMAGLKRVARIDQNQLYAKLHRLVGHELAQLVERPTVATPPLMAGQLICALPHSSQVLQCNCLMSHLGSLHQAIADAVIGMRLKAFLLAQ